MLKIAHLEHWTENLELTRPYRIANRTFTDVENHFVRIEAQSAFKILDGFVQVHDPAEVFHGNPHGEYL